MDKSVKDDAVQGTISGKEFGEQKEVTRKALLKGSFKMRESIGKYRGKCSIPNGYHKKGDWVYGYLVRGEMSYIIPSYQFSSAVVSMGGHMATFCTVVDPETVGEYYTTTTDGVEFYEGDIISSRDRPKNKHIIKYNENEARFDCEMCNSKFPQFTGLRKSWLEEFDKIVIGTIHDKEKPNDN